MVTLKNTNVNITLFVFNEIEKNRQGDIRARMLIHTPIFPTFLTKMSESEDT